MRTILLFLSMVFFSAPVLAEGSVSCPYHSGVYAPHPSVAFWLKKFDYKMSIKESEGGFDPQTFHSADVHIDAYDKKTHKKVSSYIAPIYCGMGSSGCYFEDKIRFFDLNKDFSRYLYKEKFPEAPYAYVLTDTPEFTKTKKDDSRFLFYTPEKEIPSFHGATLWILESCDENRSKPDNQESYVEDSFEVPQEVVFKTLKNEELKKYPAVLDFVSIYDELDQPFQVEIGLIKNKKIGTIAILSVQGSLTCGTFGCSLFAYKFTKKDNNALPINFNVNAGLPIYKMYCDDNLYLILSGGGGISKGVAAWKYFGGDLLYVYGFDTRSEISCEKLNSTHSELKKEGKISK